jgi:hypothetical protein
MRVEVMAAVMVDLAVTMAGMLPEDMPPGTLRVDTLVSMLAVNVLSILREPHAGTRTMQVAHIIGMAVVTGEAVVVTGEAVTGIRHMDILGLAITAWVMAIRTTDIIHGDITLTVTDTGRI